MSCLEKYRGRFDAVLNLYNSFGYYPTDRENERVMRQLVSCLKSGGKLCLHLVDRHGMGKSVPPSSWRENRRCFVLVRHDRPGGTRFYDTEWVILFKGTGRVLRYRWRLRAYGRDEIVALMRKCGLRKIRVWGEITGDPYRRGKSTHPLYVGVKA